MIREAVRRLSRWLDRNDASLGGSTIVSIECVDKSECRRIHAEQRETIAQLRRVIPRKEIHEDA